MAATVRWPPPPFRRRGSQGLCPRNFRNFGPGIAQTEVRNRLKCTACCRIFAAMATASPKREAAEPKRERMELRVTTAAKALIQRAAAVSGLSAGDLAYEGARRVLDAHQHMELVGANAEAFLRALDEPPEPNERLVEAVRRYRSMVG